MKVHFPKHKNVRKIRKKWKTVLRCPVRGQNEVATASKTEKKQYLLFASFVSKKMLLKIKILIFGKKILLDYLLP